MSGPLTNDPDADPRAGYFDDDSRRYHDVYRWWIWTGRPLLKRSRGDDDVPLPRTLRPYQFPMNVLRIIGCLLFAMTLSLIVWGLCPFLIIWLIGSLLKHSTAFVSGMHALFWLQAFFVFMITFALAQADDERRRRVLERVRSGYAGLALPVLMYVTAASQPDGFTVMGQSSHERQSVFTWLAFYAYMYADILSFGAMESLIGQLTALQPSSFGASLYTFLTQFLMTVSVLYHAFKYVKGRIFATDEFSGTLPELLVHLNETAPSGSKCYVMPRSVEVRVKEFDGPVPVDAVFDITERDPRLKLKKRFESAIGRFLNPGVRLQVVVIAIVLFGMIVSLIPWGVAGTVIALVSVLFAGTIALLLPALSRAREAAERVKCGSQLRQVGIACIVYANEHGVFPPSLQRLVEDGLIDESQLICPTHLRLLRQAQEQKVAGPSPLVVATPYVYLGAGRRSDADAATIVAVDRPESHRRGGNVLFGDGTVKWLDAAQFDQVLSGAGVKRPQQRA